MEKVKFKRYGQDGYIKFDIKEHSGDYLSDILSIGYTNKIDFLGGYFFSDFGVPFVELNSFRHKDNGTCICSLWDHKEELFEFYCENSIEELSCVK